MRVQGFFNEIGLSTLRGSVLAAYDATDDALNELARVDLPGDCGSRVASSVEQARLALFHARLALDDA